MPDTSTRIPRPPRASADQGRTRVADPTRGVRRDRQLGGRRWNLVLFLLASAIVIALAATLFLLPINTYLGQDERLDQRSDQLERIESVVADLRSEVDRLGTDEGVREAAREELGFTEAGERRQTLSALPAVPTDLPDGWPYDLVTSIGELRGVTPPPSTTAPATTVPAAGG